MAPRAGFEINGTTVAPGTRRTVDLPVSVMSDHTPVTMSVHVVHGKRPGPTLFVSAAIHGDEVIGVEIVRRLLRSKTLAGLRGTLLAVPIVNTLGFIHQSRYLPDRRDLNRSFPGTVRGSLAARLADLFVTQVVARSDVGIDLHSAAIHRTNLPQIRVSPGRPRALALAEAFGAPVILTSSLREGSLRAVAAEHDVEMLLFEAGEALRFDEYAARAGAAGIQRVMRELGMLPAKGIARARAQPLHSVSSYWVRSPAGGLFRPFRSIGEEVDHGGLLGAVSGPFGEVEEEIRADTAGLIVGRANLPVVNEGDALFHVAQIKEHPDPEATVDRLSTQLEGDPLFDEDEII
ncbi:succinylglutamate desuccinylase/aspartoacylase family protein [Rhodovulum sp. YNF3179]|uniref:succinylglutamate desuccinylase/aspartoacylase family protein n=1 Tax=Rhodovulum sp. YNF3179 TaxID=3425127 RepID=UPI003D359B0B